VDETKPNQTPNQTQPPTPGIWKEGAKALAQFQEQHAAIAKTGEVNFKGKGDRRTQYSYSSLSDVLQAAQPAAAFGLSHSGQSRVLAAQGMIWREYLHHSSGEQIWCEYYIPLPQSSMFTGDTHKELGGAITYARKYCIQSLFGLYGDNSADPDAIQGPPNNPPTSAPASVAAPKQQQQAVVVTPDKDEDPNRPIRMDEKAAVIKALGADPKLKEAFMKAFYPSYASGLTEGMIDIKAHHDFIKVPF
jgi:hypothetical protein